MFFDILVVACESDGASLGPAASPWWSDVSLEGMGGARSGGVLVYPWGSFFITNGWPKALGNLRSRFINTSFVRERSFQCSVFMF